LLKAFRDLFAKHGTVLTSAEVVRQLTAEEDSEWAEFRGRGPITKRQIALLLDPYDIHPDLVHPGGRRTERGYDARQFESAFAHYLGKTPSFNRSTVRRKRKRRK
jgi:hypothetical protein